MLYTTIKNMPEYKLTLVDKSEQTNEEIPTVEQGVING